MGSAEIQIDETGPDFLLLELEAFRRSACFADIEFITEDQIRVPAHSAVIAPASKFLNKLVKTFQTHYASLDRTSILLPEVKASDLNNVLHLLYSGTVVVPVEEHKNLIDVINLLDFNKELFELDDNNEAMGWTRVKEENTLDDYSDSEWSMLEPQTSLIEIPNVTLASKGEARLGQKKSKLCKSRAHIESNRTLDSTALDAVALLPTQPLLPEEAMDLFIASKQELDERTREILEQNDMESHPGRKFDKCKCINCLNPNRSHSTKMGRSMHVCHYPDCQRAYKKTSHLRSHLRSHIGDTPFACSWDGCGRKFTRSDELHRHYRIHTGEKRHFCPIPNCGRAFARSDHLKKHIVSHGGMAS